MNYRDRATNMSHIPNGSNNHVQSIYCAIATTVAAFVNPCKYPPTRIDRADMRFDSYSLYLFFKKIKIRIGMINELQGWCRGGHIKSIYRIIACAASLPMTAAIIGAKSARRSIPSNRIKSSVL